jgi:hypothetical protein
VALMHLCEVGANVVQVNLVLPVILVSLDFHLLDEGEQMPLKDRITFCDRDPAYDTTRLRLDAPSSSLP